MPTSDIFRDELLRRKLEPRRAVHSFHRYFGKIIPAIPAAAICAYTTPDDIVVDAFAGSGTTLVEASAAQRASVGLDLNPLATHVSRVKTTFVEHSTLLNAYTDVIEAFRDISGGASDDSLPYVVNLNHWFRPEVLAELLRLRAAIQTLQDSDVKNFFRACMSAFIRGVSNADPQHVFPGYSKRMRALDAAGREINVMRSFERAFTKRARAIAELRPDAAKAFAFTDAARHVGQYANDAALAVINPPYISSIRYLETMKIEMGWLDIVTSRAEYLAMDKAMLGTERFYKSELATIEPVGIREVDEQIERLSIEAPKMAKVVSEYFHNLRPSLEAIIGVLRPKGHLVVKISDTSLRGEVVRTGVHMRAIGENAGMHVVHDFSDEYDPNSRSLLTARNSYSGLMTRDQILVLQKD